MDPLSHKLSENYLTFKITDVETYICQPFSINKEITIIIKTSNYYKKKIKYNFYCKIIRKSARNTIIKILLKTSRILIDEI